MRPITILFLMPMLLGVAAEMVFRDARNASLVAAAGSFLAICLCVKWLDPTGDWSWIAAVLVSPVSIALAIGAVVIRHGRLKPGVRKRERGARLGAQR